MPANLQSGITVLGAGAWGTALAIVCANNGYAVSLWSHDRAHIAAMTLQRQNTKYLPGVQFPEHLQLEADFATAVQAHSHILVMVPSHAFRGICKRLTDLNVNISSVAWGTKGFDPDTGELLSTVARQELGPKVALAVISGPTFAAEISRGLPAALACASDDKQAADQWAAYLRSATLRVYTNQDLIGTQLGGALKNVMAIAAGAVEGLQLGANASAALVTRGLAEMMRLGVKLGADPQTLMGLAGMGDLVLSCTDNQSRNRRYGVLRAQGNSHAQTLAIIGHVVEGTLAAKHAWKLAQQHNVDMPITDMVYRFVAEQISAEAAVKGLFGREPKSE